MLRFCAIALGAALLGGCYESEAAMESRFRQQIRADLDASCRSDDTDCRLRRLGDLRAANDARPVYRPTIQTAAPAASERISCQTVPGLAGWSQTTCTSY